MKTETLGREENKRMTFFSFWHPYYKWDFTKIYFSFWKNCKVSFVLTQCANMHTQVLAILFLYAFHFNIFLFPLHTLAYFSHNLCQILLLWYKATSYMLLSIEDENSTTTKKLLYSSSLYYLTCIETYKTYQYDSPRLSDGKFASIFYCILFTNAPLSPDK